MSSGDDLKEVSHDSVVRDSKDRRRGIAIDGDDDVRALHAGEMLDLAGDAQAK